jgi:hypothetical protein
VRYARHPEVLWRSTSQGPVVLLPDREDPTRLGGLAAVVWELLDRPLTIDELADEAMRLFDERPDLTACLGELLRAGAVLVSDA